MESILIKQLKAASKPAQPAPSLDVFLETQRTYFETLSVEEKSTLPRSQSSAELIEEIRKLGAFSSSSHERRLRNSLRKVQNFSERIEPYFETVGIIVQSHPEIASIIWGSIRGALLVPAPSFHNVELLTTLVCL